MEENNPNSINGRLGEFYPVYFSFVGEKIGTEFFHVKKPWVWPHCGVSFSKISDKKMKFIIRRQKKIKLKYNPKTCIKNAIKDGSNDNPEWYALTYRIEFEVNMDELPYEIIHATKKISEKKDHNEEMVNKECWLLELGKNHHVWQRKDATDVKRSIIHKIKEEIAKKKNEKPSTDLFTIANYVSNNNKILPVIYHPARDFNPNDIINDKNYIREIHLHPIPRSNKFHVTIIFAGERLRKHWYVHYIYKLYRLIVYGRTFDVESFNIIREDQKHIKFDFPKIYSKEDDNIYVDNAHGNRCSVDASYYFDNVNHPCVFVNTANHAMAECDRNPYKWKVEYVPWEPDCPIYLGDQKRCDIEKRLRVLYLNPFLFKKCHDSSYVCCNEGK